MSGVIDLTDVKEWSIPVLLTANTTSKSMTVTGADWSGTWAGKVRSEGPEGTDQSLTITVTGTYSAPTTTITFSLTGSELLALIATGDREWRGWLTLSRTTSTVKGLNGPIIVRRTGI